jgi:predicted neuraminidase
MVGATKTICYWALIVLSMFWGCSMKQRSSGLSKSLEQAIIFPLQNEHVHGPSIVELPNGDLLSAWFQGSGERWADDVRIMGARLMKGDTTWSEPFILADTPGFPDVNPALFMDMKDRLWLIWYPVVANQWETSIPKYRISEDYESEGAPVWSWQDIILVKPGDKTERGIQPGDRFVEAVRSQLETYEKYINEELLEQFPIEQRDYLMQRWEGYKRHIDSLAGGENMMRSGRLQKGEGYENATLGYPLSRRIGWQTKNKPIIISDRIIIPLYSDGLNCSLFAMTDDLGKTWQFSNPVIGGIGIQPTIAIARDGVLSAYLRDNGPPPKRMQVTNSSDGGYTWTIAKDTEIPNPGAGFDMVTLSTGEWLMVYNDTESGRHDLTVAISDDEGASWQWKKKIEYDDRGEEATSSHYPAVIQGGNDLIHVVYSYHHKDRAGGPHKTIKYAVFPVQWVKE